jgi:hypothetical protein
VQDAVARKKYRDTERGEDYTLGKLLAVWRLRGRVEGIGTAGRVRAG